MRPPPLVREPLVQFLAIGAVLAGLYALVPEEPAAVAPATAEPILVTEGRIEQLRQLFARTWQRPPTPEELDHIVNSFVREEVLYRAGRDLGLEEDDTVVRRRIAQKMEFLLEPAPGEIVPTDDDLARHLAAFPERFAKPARITFDQVFVDPARHGRNVPEEVDAILEALREGADPAGVGDPTLVPARFDDETDGAVTRILGRRFADALLEAPLGTWAGPLPSPYGAHLVRVRDRVTARAPALGEVRDAVAADWEALRRREVADERFEALKARYAVEVARPDRPDAAVRADERASVDGGGEGTPR